MQELERKKRRALRIAEQRNTALVDLLLAEGLRECHPVDAALPNVRRARAIAHAFDRYPVEVLPDDLLAGRYCTRPLTPDEEATVPAARARLYQETAGLRFGWGVTGRHRVIDFRKLLRVGVRGLLEEVMDRERALDLRRPEYAERRGFYRSCRIVLEGLLRFAARYCRAARQCGADRTADLLARVPGRPPRTFHEALQSAWFVQFATIFDDGSSTGRPDRYLYPFYRRDLEEGGLTPEDALELIAELYLRSNEVYEEWPETIMLGGSDPEGEPVCNELTRLFIEAVETVGLVNPNVGLCYCEETPEDLLLKCVEKISRGLSHPAIFNDRVIRRGLEAAGLASEDACNYINSTCVEITPIGCSNVLVTASHVSPAKVLEVMLNRGRQTVPDERHLPRDAGEDAVQRWQRPLQQGGMRVDLRQLGTFEQFMDAYRRALAVMVRDCVGAAAEYFWRATRYAAAPLVSCLTRDCLERGRDATAGGARSNYCGMNVAGFATAADALCAVREVVYRRRMASLPELAEALRRNFAGAEPLRRWILNRCPRYGNDDPDADALAVDLYSFLCEELARYRNCLGDGFYVGAFSGWGGRVDGRRVSSNVSRGLVTGATPDGRLAGEPLSECIGPAPGSDGAGLTALANSITRMDHSHGLGGISLNCRLSPGSLGTARDRRKVARFIRQLMRQGAFHVQFNVVDSALLREARAHPERHPTLTVRVAGYSAYFSNLGQPLQAQIIARAEHGPQHRGAEGRTEAT